jgi:hypothetical protein
MNWIEKTNYKTEMMKRRLTYNGKQVYIKKLKSKYAIVSYHKEGSIKQFKVDIKDLADIK